MTVLDTSVLLDSLAGAKRSARVLRAVIEQGERILLPSLVLFEWLRGPRSPLEIAAQESLFPSESAVVFGYREASLSAELYRTISRPRGREVDICIAACAMARNAELWTLNKADFRDIPQLRLAAF